MNTLFSTLELNLARNSPITLPRMFVGPGKRWYLAARPENDEEKLKADYVIQAKFDPICEAILTGKEIDLVVILSREMRFTQFIDVRGEDIFEKSVYI